VLIIIKWRLQKEETKGPSGAKDKNIIPFFEIFNEMEVLTQGGYDANN